MELLPPEFATLIARRFAMLSDPTRLRLLNVIHREGEASVGELAEAVGGTQANVSKHLGLMLSERMVARRRDGSRALYSVADPTLMAICDQVCASVSDEIRRLGALTAIGAAE